MGKKRLCWSTAPRAVSFLRFVGPRGGNVSLFLPLVSYMTKLGNSRVKVDLTIAIAISGTCIV